MMGFALAVVLTASHAEALCMPPVAVTETAPTAHRYAWFFVESLARASLAWKEADQAADAKDAVSKLAGYKLAVEDFECAASLLQRFMSPREPVETATGMVGVSAESATLAYEMFAKNFQRLTSALAQGRVLQLEEAADFKVQNEKAAEWLIHAPAPAGFSLLKPQRDSTTPMDTLVLTRAERRALLNELRRRFPTSRVQTIGKGDHSPELAAKILDKFLSNPLYKSIDQ
jgi:hypothetical protein